MTELLIGLVVGLAVGFGLGRWTAGPRPVHVTWAEPREDLKHLARPESDADGTTS